MRQVLGARALGRPRGIGWRGRWEGGSGWGIYVYPWLIHVSVWQKPLQYCKVISLQLIKINEKKKKEEIYTREKKKTYKKRSQNWAGASLLFLSFGLAHPQAWRMYFPLLSK